MSRNKPDTASSGDACPVTPPASRRVAFPALAALSLAGLCAFPLYAARAQQKATPIRSAGQPKTNAVVGTPVGTDSSSVRVLTQRNDNTRAGVNANETLLYPPGGKVSTTLPTGAPANYGLVSQATFGKLFTRSLDGPCYAQPLYYQNLVLSDPVNPRVTSTHNVVFVATNNNSVYAFDADSNTGSNTAALWHINFNRARGGAVPTAGSDITDILGLPQGDIQPLVGIVGTPVINDANKTLYVVVRTTEGPRYVHRLHAINIATGQEQFYSPQLIGQIQDQFGIVSPVVVPGSGDDADGNGSVFFDLLNENQRPALALVNGAVYVAYGSFDNVPPYHGWLFSFDAATLNPVGVFNTSPNAASDFTLGAAAVSGGIDMSGSGPASDGTSLFLSTGEGTFNANDGGTEYGESILKLGLSPTVIPLNPNAPLPSPYLPQFPVLDTFTPFNILDLANTDTDLGTGGVALFDTTSPAGNFLVTAGQEGRIYLLNRNALGGLGDVADTGAITTLPNAVGPVYGAPAVYTAVNPTTGTSTTNVYFHGTGDVLKAFPFSGGVLSATPTTGNGTFDFPGAMPVVSSNGTTNGIVWEVESHVTPFPSPLGGGVQDQAPTAVLHAYDATTLNEIYSSGAAGSGGTSIGDYVKFTMPTVANGKVFVTAGTPTQFDPGGPITYPSGQLVVFGPVTTAPATQGYHYQLSGPVGWAALSTNHNLLKGSPVYPLPFVAPLPLFPRAAASVLAVNANRQNFYSITAVDNNNQPAKVTTKALVTVTDVNFGGTLSVGTVKFTNQSNVVVSLTLRTPGSYLMKVQDVNGNSSQANHNFPGFPYIGPQVDDAPYIVAVPANPVGFDHFTLRVPPAVTDGTPTNISITPSNYRGFPVGHRTAVTIYDTLPDGVQDFQLPADDNPVDGFGILNDLFYEPKIIADPLTAHSEPTSSTAFAYEFQYGIADYALTPGYTIGIDDFPNGAFGTNYPNPFGTGTYPCVFNGVGRHVVIVVDGSGIATTAVVNVIGKPTAPLGGL
jgi:hypothetical protein